MSDRRKLAKIGEDDRHLFFGTFERFGTKRGWKGRLEQTVLLLNIKDDNGSVVTDHLWFNYTKGFSSLDLTKGDTVKFNAKVASYLKGYMGHDEIAAYLNPVTISYKLSYPTNIDKLINPIKRIKNKESED